MDHKIAIGGDAKQDSRKPVDNDFKQQRLRAWQPLLTPKYVIGSFTFIGILFIIIGIICLSASNTVIEKEVDSYEDATLETTKGQSTNITRQFTLDKKIPGPVYFYYKLTNFYQNHRRYVKSRSDSQLKGDSNPDLTGCDPLEKLTEAGTDKTLIPCGLIAASFFSDKFQLCRGNVASCTPTSEAHVSWKKDGIAWKSDVSDKFKPMSDAFDPTKMTRVGPQGNVLPSSTDLDLIVWMRTAGLPTFKKLAWIIGEDLEPGTYTYAVNYNFQVTSFNGKKQIVLSNTTWLGGANMFLGGAYLAVGLLCLLLAGAFGLKHHMSPRPLGDMKYFNWPGVQPLRANS